MNVYTITNPQAAQAIRLAHAMPYISRATITHELNAMSIPRGLFVLACVLRAASARGF